jgi:hypothetical protein
MYQDFSLFFSLPDLSRRTQNQKVTQYIGVSGHVLHKHAQWKQGKILPNVLISNHHRQQIEVGGKTKSSG